MSSLTFSFWTSMLAPACEDMWQTTLNRIAHHEPIMHWNLDKHYANILRITGWLSPAAAW